MTPTDRAPDGNRRGAPRLIGRWSSGLALLAEKFVRLERRVPAFESRLQALEGASRSRHISASDLITAAGPREHLKLSVAIPIASVEPFVRECLDSVVNAAGFHELIIIDDRGGGAEVPAWLQRIVSCSGAQLMRHHVQLGYTASANQALTMASGDVLVLLNSDTVVPHGWLAKLTCPLIAHPETALVGPWSNAATYQSMPIMPDDGNYEVNGLPSGLTLNLINSALDNLDARYPVIRCLNGFCFAVRLDAATQIGLFSLQDFPEGYGEEVDYCLRASALGYQCRVVDNLFVLHHKSQSFGAERRKNLTELGREALVRRYGAHEIGRLLFEMREWSLGTFETCRTRSRLQQVWETPDELTPSRGRPTSVAFVVPTRPEGGGVLSIIDDARALHRLGLSVSLVVNPEFADQYGSLVACNDVTIVAADIVGGSQDATRRFVAKYDCLVPTYWTSVEPIARAALPQQVVVHYIQDFEPDFFVTPVLRSAALAALFVDRVDTIIVRTPWLRERLFQATGQRAATIAPAIDEERIPKDWRPFASRRYDVAAMVRPETPRRAADLTVDVMRELVRIRPSTTCVLFGSGAAGSDWPDGIVAAGALDNAGAVALLGNSRAFVDLSDWQALGRTALEALQCGAIPFMAPDSGLLDFLGEDAATLAISRDGGMNEIAGRLADALDSVVTSSYQQRLLHRVSTFSSAEAAGAWRSILLAGSDRRRARHDHSNNLRKTGKS